MIYAQTDVFSVTGDCVEPAPVDTCPPATATVTVTRAVRPPVKPTTTVIAGWCSDYNHPVILTAAPTATANAAVLASTSTIYQTVYRDLSEGCGAC